MGGSRVAPLASAAGATAGTRAAKGSLGGAGRLKPKAEKIESEPPCCPKAAPPNKATAMPSGRPASAKPAEILIATAIKPTRIRWVVFKTILLFSDEPCGKSGYRQAK